MENKPVFKNRHNQVYIIGDKEVWESRSVAINVAIIAKVKGNLYLLCGKRGKGTPDFQGYWNIPAGYLDWDENGTEACYREVWEETGFNIQSYKKNEFIQHLSTPWGVVTEPSSNKQNVSLRYGVFYHFDELPTLTTENSEEDEVEEVEWFELNDISDLDKKEWAFNHKQLVLYYIKKLGLLNDFHSKKIGLTNDF